VIVVNYSTTYGASDLEAWREKYGLAMGTEIVETMDEIRPTPISFEAALGDERPFFVTMSDELEFKLVEVGPKFKDDRDVRKVTFLEVPVTLPRLDAGSYEASTSGLQSCVAIVMEALRKSDTDQIDRAVVSHFVSASHITDGTLMKSGQHLLDYMLSQVNLGSHHTLVHLLYQKLHPESKAAAGVMGTYLEAKSLVNRQPLDNGTLKYIFKSDGTSSWGP